MRLRQRGSFRMTLAASARGGLVLLGAVLLVHCTLDSEGTGPIAAPTTETSTETDDSGQDPMFVGSGGTTNPGPQGAGGN